MDVLRALDKGEVSPDVTQFNILIFATWTSFTASGLRNSRPRSPKTALWLMDHQMNMRVSEEFGQYYVRFLFFAQIAHHRSRQRAARTGGRLSRRALSYILFAPPFGGKQYPGRRTKSRHGGGFYRCRVLEFPDFVAAWYRRKLPITWRRIQPLKTAFVSTEFHYPK